MAVKKSHTRPFLHCPNCGSLVRLNGAGGGRTPRVDQNSNECPNCGYRTSFNVARNPDKYCGNCGKMFGGGVTGRGRLGCFKPPSAPNLNHGVQIDVDFDTGAGNLSTDEPALVPTRLRHIVSTRWGKMHMDVKRLENKKESAA